MDAKDTATLHLLRATLQGMPPTGHKGFEGLIGLVLGEITGLSFSLAASGAQGGSDGDATAQGDRVSFECKRYEESPGKAEVFAKLPELEARSDVDLWVLCATAKVSSQIRGVLDATSARSGLEIAVLDWPEGTVLADLAVAFALVRDERLAAHLTAVGLADGALDAILAGCAVLRSQPGFGDAKQRVRAKLDLTGMAYSSAKAANARWLLHTFSTRNAATIKLGQPLAPADHAYGPVLRRNHLTDCLLAHMTGPRPQGPLLLIGDEGVGKSWAPANAWLHASDRPMLLMVSAEQFDRLGAASTTALVATVLGEQVEGLDAAYDPARWTRKIARWMSAESSQTISLVIVLDGINQRPDMPWHRVVDQLYHDLGPIGARVIVSSRSRYFDAKLKGRFTYDPFPVLLGPWTEGERDEILTAAGIEPRELAGAVANALNNPRLLSIALQLMGKDALKNLQELSISRLLFEHIRSQSKDDTSAVSAHDFAQGLVKHAREILQRHGRKELEDLLVFADTTATAESRFFRPMPGEPSLYELDPNGLTVALGIALVEDLKKKRRNGFDLQDAIHVLIDPISALDDTADVLMAAMTVTSIDDKDDHLLQALIVSFAGAQNVSEDHRIPFEAIARPRTFAFAEAFREVVLDVGFRLNQQWLESALRATRHDDAAWQRTSVSLKLWLRSFSHNAHVPRRDDETDDAWARKATEHRAELATKIEGLCDLERDLFHSLTIIAENPSPLVRAAFELIAGMPLVPFVDDLVRWRFGIALNHPYMAPTSEFSWLGGFNRADWAQARSLVNDWALRLLDGSPTDTGVMAAIGLLMMTGDATDAQRGMSAHAAMRSKPLRSSFVSVPDPTDPDAAVPQNGVLATAVSVIANLPVSALHAHFGQTGEDHDLLHNIPLLARFDPQYAIEKLRLFCDDVMSRTGLPLRQGLIALLSMPSVITRTQALDFIEFRRGALAIATSSMSPNERSMLATFCLTHALPQLSADEQLVAILDDSPDQNLFLSLFPLFEPASTDAINRAIRRVMTCTSKKHRAFLLDFLGQSGSALDATNRDLVSALLPTEAGYDVHALAFLASHGTDRQLREFVGTGWTAGEQGDIPESFYGSGLLVEAVRRHIVSAEEIVRRIHPTAYSSLALCDNEGALAVGLIISEYLRSVPPSLPEPTIRLEAHISLEQPLFPRHLTPSAFPKQRERRDPFAAFMDKSAEDFTRRHEQIHEQYIEFRGAMSEKNALVALDDLDLEAFQAVAQANPSLMDGWETLLLSADKNKARWVANLARMLFLYFSQSDTDRAIRLFDTFCNVDPHVRMTFGYAHGSLEATVIWAAPDLHQFDVRRTARLDKARNDLSISREVLAAALAGKHESIDAYVNRGLISVHPADKARALTVLGFLPYTRERLSILQTNAETGGLAGTAASTAFESMSRDKSALHWFRSMMGATSPEDYWRFDQLFLSTLDARVDVWARPPPDASDIVRRYWPASRTEIKHRVRRFDDARERLFLGQTTPTDVFHPVPIET